MLTKATSTSEQLSLEGWESFRTLKNEGTAEDALPSWNDKLSFVQMHEALTTLGFTETKRMELYTMLGIVLHLGNIDFIEDGDGGASIGNRKLLELCEQLLKVDQGALETALCSRSLGSSIEVIKVPLSVHQASIVRNALCMHLYGLAFDWCIAEINTSIAVADEATSMGVLDIFGFENFEVNSFAQLCINYTNETLHQLFINHIFKLEQAEYVAQGLEWQVVDYIDNAHVIDTIAGPKISVLSLLDQASLLEAATDERALQTMHTNLEKREAYIKPKKNSDQGFGISHYAGDVAYKIAGFVDSNKGDIPADLTTMLEQSTGNTRLSTLTKQAPTPLGAAQDSSMRTLLPTPRRNKKLTVSSAFKESLKQLTTRLGASELSYIRCLKPNQRLTPGEWDADFMGKQLAYSGTLEVAQVRAHGFSVRYDFEYVLSYFSVAAADPKIYKPATVRERTATYQSAEEAQKARDQMRSEMASQLVEELVQDQSLYKIGTTKVFLREAAVRKLKEARRAFELQQAKYYLYVLELQMLIKRALRKYLKRKREEKEAAQRALEAAQAAELARAAAEEAQKLSAEKNKAEKLAAPQAEEMARTLDTTAVVGVALATSTMSEVQMEAVSQTSEAAWLAKQEAQITETEGNLQDRPATADAPADAPAAPQWEDLWGPETRWFFCLLCGADLMPRGE